MGTSTIRVFAFFGLLFIASFLLSPGLFLTFLAYRRQVWVVRRANNQLWTRVTIPSTVLFFALCAWLVYSKPGGLHEDARNQSRLNSHSPSDSSGAQLRMARVRVGQ